MYVLFALLSREPITAYGDMEHGPFQNVNQSMFTEIEVANQWPCRAHNNFCPTYTKEHVLFVCDKACEHMTQKWIENDKRTIEGGDVYIFIPQCGTVHC